MTGPIIPGGISCRELVELVTGYLDGALGPTETTRMDEHLKLCGPCSAYVEQLRTTVRLAAVATAELDLRPDRSELLRAFTEFRRQRTTDS
jgi:predicted anti-sigma-YlaC factor YlaD